HWVGGSDDWTAAGSDWSLGAPPTAEIPAVIDATGTYTVSISSADTAASLTINDANATVEDESGGSLALGGALTITAGAFDLTGGTITGLNVLSIGSSGTFDVES